MSSNPEIPQVYKVEREELSPPEHPDISFDEAISWIALQPKLKQDLLPAKLTEDLADGKDLKDLLKGKFSELALRGQKLKEISGILEQTVERSIRNELMQAAASFLKSAHGLELDPKLFSEFKIVFLDDYRWASFFLQRKRQIFGSNIKAAVVPEDGLIIIKTDEYTGENLDKLDSTRDDNIKTGKLRMTILHEFLHALSAINYWAMEARDGEGVLAARRVGLTSMRLRKTKTENGKPVYKYVSSLHSLYEGVIEELTIAIALNKLTSAIPLGVIEEEAAKIYSGEIDVLRNLTARVPLSYFVKAVFEKEALRELVKKVNAACGPRYLEVIGELMKWEKGYGYPSTIKFIQGGKIKTPASVFKRVNPKFVTEHYPNIHLS